MVTVIDKSEFSVLVCLCVYFPPRIQPIILSNGHLPKIFTDLKVPTFPPLLTAQNTFLTIKIINNKTTSKHAATCFDLQTKSLWVRAHKLLGISHL